jgi:hypothetical protein
MSKTNNIVTFVDHIGRTIIGTSEGDIDKGAAFLVRNPAIIHVQPTQTGQLNVQTIPMYFREFLGEKSREAGTVWKFNYASVVMGTDVRNDERLITQYERLFSNAPGEAPKQAEQKDERVIKLFDE